MLSSDKKMIHQHPDTVDTRHIIASTCTDIWNSVQMYIINFTRDSNRIIQVNQPWFSNILPEWRVMPEQKIYIYNSTKDVSASSYLKIKFNNFIKNHSTLVQSWKWYRHWCFNSIVSIFLLSPFLSYSGSLCCCILHEWTEKRNIIVLKGFNCVMIVIPVISFKLGRSISREVKKQTWLAYDCPGLKTDCPFCEIGQSYNFIFFILPSA